MISLYDDVCFIYKMSWITEIYNFYIPEHEYPGYYLTIYMKLAVCVLKAECWFSFHVKIYEKKSNFHFYLTVF